MNSLITRTTLAGAFLLLVALTVSATPPIFANNSGLHMDVYGGYLLVIDASIGQFHGLRFLLDTGATSTAIDRKLAERLGLVVRRGELLSFDKTVGVDLAQLSVLSYGPEHFSDVPVVVQDMSYFLGIGIHVDGIIGWDLLRTTSFRLDLSRKLVSFGPINGFPGRSVPLRPESCFLTVQIDVGGRPMSMIADTGLFGTAFYEGSVEGTRAARDPWGRSIGRSIGGVVRSRNVLVPRLRLGDQDLDREVQLVQRPSSRTLPGIAGYLGISALDAKQIAFDFEHNELRWSAK